MNTPPRVRWSPGDRLLMIVLAVFLPLVFGFVLWLRALDQNPTVSIPAPLMPARNAHDYYLAAMDSLADRNKIDNAVGSWNPAAKPVGDWRFYPLPEKEKLIAENMQAIQALHTGFHYPYREPPEQLSSTEFADHERMRALARLLSLEAQVSAAEGNWGGSVNAALDAVQMGEQMPHGSPLIGMLVGVACQAIGRKQAWVADSHLSAVQARAAARRLESIREAHVPFGDTLQEEKWRTQAHMLALMRRPSWPANLGTFAGDAPNILPTQMFLLRCRLSGKRTIMANYTHGMDAAIADAHQPYAAHLPPAALPGDPESRFLLPVFASARLSEVEADTQNALLLTVLALQAYKSEHGTYPAALAALMPGYLRVVPADPFALSGPLRYKRVGTNYLLYSVGPDGRDDGGSAIFDRTQPAPATAEANDRRRYIQEDSKGDVVAGVNTQ